MKVLKLVFNWKYGALLWWTRRLSKELTRGDYDKAKLTDEKIINNYNYGIDRDAWIKLTRLRMKLHYKLGNITQAWQLGNNLFHMMGDVDPDSIVIYNEIVAAKNISP